MSTEESDPIREEGLREELIEGHGEVRVREVEELHIGDGLLCEECEEEGSGEWRVDRGEREE